LNTRLEAIETEIGFLNPGYDPTATSRLDNLEAELLGTSDSYENSRIDLLENEVDNIINGPTIVKNSE